MLYQQVEGDKDGAWCESYLSPGRGQFPQQEHKEGHIRDQQ